MIKLVAIDMDGTLLNSNNDISDENKNAILQAIESGVHVVIATGRDYPDATKLLHKAGLYIPVISINGAQVYSATGELLHTVAFDRQQAEKIHRIAKEEQIFHVLFTDQGVFPCPDTYSQLKEEFRQDAFQGMVSQERVERYIAYIRNQIEAGEHLNHILDQPNVSYLKYVLSSYRPDKLQLARHRLQSIEQLAISSSFRTNIEINHLDGEKGKALINMAKQLGVPMEQTMAIGDNWNDLSMFRVAGLSVAMGNAEPELAKNCDQITKVNNEHGVAYAFEQWVL